MFDFMDSAAVVLVVRIGGGFLGGIAGYQGALWWRRRVWGESLQAALDGSIAMNERGLLSLREAVREHHPAEAAFSQVEEVSMWLQVVVRRFDALNDYLGIGPVDLLDPESIVLSRTLTAARKYLTIENDGQYTLDNLISYTMTGAAILDRLEYGPAKQRDWRRAWLAPRSRRGWFSRKHDWKWEGSRRRASA